MLDERLEEAKRLEAKQVKERGKAPWYFDGTRTWIRGPYVPTPEREARAARILELRRRAARG